MEPTNTFIKLLGWSAKGLNTHTHTHDSKMVINIIELQNERVKRDLNLQEGNLRKGS